MKKAFTLVELLIVVVVIVALMTITFRLSSVGGDNTKRNKTIERMNRIENCLSGYYAAFGSYPQVKLHGSRSIYLKTNDHGMQYDSQENKDIWGWYKETGDHGIGSTKELEAWDQVNAACKSQPFDCRFPYPSTSAYGNTVEAFSQAVKIRAQEKKSLSEKRKRVLTQPFDNGVSKNIGRFNPYMGETEWSQLQLFKFGLMSYLLPRFLVMMRTDQQFFNNGPYNGCRFAQWGHNNALPCNPLTGEDFIGGWSTIHSYLRQEAQNPKNYAAVKNIPSQAATARWLPNLRGIVCSGQNLKLYGVDLRSTSDPSGLSLDGFESLEVFVPGDANNNSSANQYILDKATVLDGWWHEFYYYSPPPYQSYTLWSAGPNNRTFPPWISRKSLNAEQNRCVTCWTADDIVRMSH